MADYDDEDDAWSYSFPPSSEALPLPDHNGGPAGGTPDPPSAADSLQMAVAGMEKSLVNGHKPSEIAPAAARAPASVRSSVELALTTDAFKREPFVGLGTSPPTPTIGAHSLQTAFMAKSQPANPHTTREDASSVISSSSNSNGLAHLETLDDERSQNQVRFRGPADAKSPGENDRTGSDDVVTSPKIIAFRKSRRTASDGSAQNLLETMALQKEKYDPKLYVEEKFNDTKYRYTTIKRNMEFHQIFRSIDLTDRLLDDFSCALSREILLQGRVYISEKYICFNSSLLGWVTSLIIPQEDIVRFEKRSTAGIFPNAILVETKETKHTFASFISRDVTYDLMKTVWEESTGREMEESPGAAVHDLRDAQDAVEDVNIESISDFIMTIDEDNQNDDDDEANGDDDDDTAQDDSAVPNGTRDVKVVQFRPDSSYKSQGPSTHLPTEATDHVDDLEQELCNEVVEAPVGVVFEILFGSSNLSFQKQFLQDHHGSDISEYGEFQPTEHDPSKRERSYHYTRSLNYRIGPQFTLCQVHEVIEHFNFDDYICVVTTVKTPDVPAGNSFSVKTKYRMNWAKDNKTNLQISFYVEWTGPSWIKSIIEKATAAGQEETCVDLLEALRQEIRQVTHEAVVEVQETDEKPAEEKPALAQLAKELPPAPQAAAITERVAGSIENLVYAILVLLVLVIIGQLLMYRQLAHTNRLLQQLQNND